MSTAIVQERLDAFRCLSAQDEENAIREIAQEVILGGLSRVGFFKKAAFQGGTCLRILYGVERFSEDLDFVLKKREPDFRLMAFLEESLRELKMFGFEFSIMDKKEAATAVQKKFLKDDSLVKLLTFRHFKPGRDKKSIRIKIEVDTNPPEGGRFETKYQDFPFVYEMTVQDLPSLFAGKCHALLCRTYVKGRDWYDFVWYVSRHAQINYELLSAAIDQQGAWQGKGLRADKSWLLKELTDSVARIDWERAKSDVLRFVKPKDIPSVNLWSAGFFLDRIQKLSEYLK
jgi:predicted nucleotidyltransferase component of viral defense system